MISAETSMSPNRRIFLNIIATYRRGLFALLWVFLAASMGAAEKEAPPAWVNAVDTNAMERVLFDYTNNVIRSEWAEC